MNNPAGDIFETGRTGQEAVPSYFRSSHDESLSLEHRVLLQHLKVIFLVGGVLVDYEDVGVEFGDDEPQVELTDDLHVFEHLLTRRDERTKHMLLCIYCVRRPRHEVR